MNFRIFFLLIYLLLLKVNLAQSFTLNNSIGSTFKENEVKISIANQSCSQIGLDSEEIKNLAEIAITKFWNTVPSSRLKLKIEGLVSLSQSFENEALCSTIASDGECTINSNLAVTSGIVISCNSNESNFRSTQTLAVTAPNHFSGNTIIGSLILLNNRSDTLLATLNKEEMISVLAHEIGHAIGLGHSPVKDSLMYYSTVNFRNYLGADDFDGMTYLYPKKNIVSCGSIENKSQTGLYFLINLILGFIICYSLYLKLRLRFWHSLS